MRTEDNIPTIRYENGQRKGRRFRELFNEILRCEGGSILKTLDRLLQGSLRLKVIILSEIKTKKKTGTRKGQLDTTLFQI